MDFSGAQLWRGPNRSTVYSVNTQ